MASLATGVRWGTASPAIYFDVSYTATRSGANMVYTVNVDFQALSSAYGRYFGYPIYLDLSLDGVTKVSKATVKNPSPSNWSAGQVYYHSTSFSVAKTTGTTTLGLKIYSGEGSTRSQSYSYSLPVTPAASEMTLPTFTVGTAGTITMTRYNAGFTDTITYTVGNATGTVVTGSTASSVSWTPPTSLYLQMVGKSSVTGTMTCKTYSGGTLVGETTKTFTLNAGSVYYRPNVTLTYERGTGSSGSNFVPDPSGSTVHATAVVKIYGTGNTCQVVVTVDGTTKVDSSGQTSGTKNYYLQNISTQSSHTMVVTITDMLSQTASMAVTISTEAVPMNLNVDLPGVAFGKLAETAKALELAGDWSLKHGGNDVDLVIGQGYDDNTKWRWRRWKSGWCEMWLDYASVTPTTSTNDNGQYYSENLYVYPPFFVYPWSVTGSVNNYSFICNIGSSATNNRYSFRIGRAAPIAVNTAHSVCLYICGEIYEP